MTPNPLARHLTTLPALQVIQDRNYRRFWLSTLSFHMTRWIEVLVLGWLTLELTDSPFMVALCAALRWFPMLAFGLFAGVIADRVDRRTLLLVDQAGCLTTGAVLSLLLLLDAVAPGHLLAASLVVGLFSAADMPARRGLMTELAGEGRVVGALTLDVISLNISGIFGGAAGGALLAWLSPAGAYLTVCAIYAAGFAALLGVHLPHPAAPFPVTARPASPLASFLSSLREGAHYAARSPVILATLAITVGMNFLVFPYKNLLPVFARDVLGVGPERLGLLSAADGVGALITTLTLAAIVQVPSKGAVYLTGSLLMACALLLFCFSTVFELSLGLLVLLGMGLSGFQTMQSGIILLSTPAEMRGRLMGILSVAIGCFPLGTLALGAAASAVPPLLAMGLAASLQVLLVAATLVTVRDLRRF